MPIESMKRSDIRKMLDHVAEENGRVMADRLLAYVSKVMSWHATRSDDFTSPIIRGMSRNATKKRQRVLTDDELAAVWKTAEGSGDTFGRLLGFLLLTASRRSEAAEMESSELAGDVWTLPGSRNKAGVDLIRPLTSEALACLPPRGLSRYVFPFPAVC
jgi:integrase